MGVKVREKVKGSGDWWIFINHQGIRKAKHVGAGKAGKRTAEAFKEQMVAKLVLGDLSLFREVPKQKPVTFGEYVEQWCQTYVAAYLKPATRDNYETAMRRHWLPPLTSKPLTAITSDDLLRIVASKRDGDRPMRLSSVHSLIIPLRACFGAAVEAGLLTRNPATHLLPARRRRVIRGEARTIDLFEAGELQALLNTADREMPESAPIITVSALAGLRIGEALTLQVDDLDFRRGELWVRRTWGRECRRLGAQQIGSPKSGEPGRVLMSQALARSLRSRVSLLQAEATFEGKPAPTWLFPEAGQTTPMRPNWFYQRVWRPLLRQAGVRYRKPHTLRHTYASVLLAGGAPPHVR